MSDAVMVALQARDSRERAPSSPFGGFTPTYWLQLAPGTFNGAPLLHLHALLFSAWTVFYGRPRSSVLDLRPVTLHQLR